jgi:phosphonate transport system substrate-binding protein
MKRAKGKSIVLLSVFLVTMILAACSKGEETTASSGVSDKKTADEVFVIALLPRENIFYQKRRYKALAEYLSRALGMNVRTRILDSYEAVYQEMLTGKVDAAFFGGLSYVVMESKIDVEPIARPVYKDGRSTYRGVIFARRDKGISGDVSTWRGKGIALVSKSTTSGYLFPRWYLHKKGVKKFGDYFSRVFYIGSHDGTIRAVMDNKVDIGCSTDRIFGKFLTGNPAARKDLIILATSGSFPSDALCIKKATLDARRLKLLKETLLRIGETEEGRKVLLSMRAAGFTETRKSDYDRIHDMMNDLALGPDFFSLGGIGHDIGGGVPGRP